MRATDFYKLLFQGVFGVGHIMGSAAWNWLRKETESVDLEGHPEEPLLEGVSADGSMVRVNLRPYLKRGLPLEDLFEAMEKSPMAAITGTAICTTRQARRWRGRGSSTPARGRRRWRSQSPRREVTAREPTVAQPAPATPSEGTPHRPSTVASRSTIPSSTNDPARSQRLVPSASNRLL